MISLELQRSRLQPGWDNGPVIPALGSRRAGLGVDQFVLMARSSSPAALRPRWPVARSAFAVVGAVASPSPVSCSRSCAGRTLGALLTPMPEPAAGGSSSRPALRSRPAPDLRGRACSFFGGVALRERSWLAPSPSPCSPSLWAREDPRSRSGFSCAATPAMRTTGAGAVSPDPADPLTLSTLTHQRCRGRSRSSAWRTFLRATGAEARLEELGADGADRRRRRRRRSGAPSGRSSRSLVLVCGTELAVLALVPGDRRADPAKVASLVGACEARVARPPEVVEATGFEPGRGRAVPAACACDASWSSGRCCGEPVVWVGGGLGAAPRRGSRRPSWCGSRAARRWTSSRRRRQVISRPTTRRERRCRRPRRSG